eukprot:IDg13213t1
MESSEAGGLRVEKLNETNFHTWKTSIKLLLSVRELKLISKKIPPSGMRAATLSGNFLTEKQWGSLASASQTHFSK